MKDEDIYRDPVEDIPAKGLRTLIKLYPNENEKYRGSTYDILDTKLIIFYNYYNKSGI